MNLATKISDVPQFKAERYAVQIAKTQALRYRDFYQENQGQPPAEIIRLKREVDEWGDVAFHINVTDQKADNAVVGSLRLTSNTALNPGQSFYTEKTFNLDQLRNNYERILELSRYCIDPSGRSGAILILIWKYAMKFIIDHKYQLMLGGASFHGTEVSQHKDILTYLYKHNLAPKELMPRPIVDNHIAISELNQHQGQWGDAKKAVPNLPRGYLKLGTKITDTAIIDQQFNPVFVSIYVDASEMLRNSHTLVPR